MPPRCPLLPNIPSLHCSEPSWLPGGHAAAVRASRTHCSVALGRPSSQARGQRGWVPTMPPGTRWPALGICSHVPGPGREAGAEPPSPSPSVSPAQPGTVGMGSRGCGVPQPRAVHAAGVAGARVPAPAGTERAGQQPRPEPINVARYSRYTLTPLFVPYSPAGASCQHPGSKSTATACLHSRAGCCTGPAALGPPRAPQS